jgi:hypothetical protein
MRILQVAKVVMGIEILDEVVRGRKATGKADFNLSSV